MRAALFLLALAVAAKSAQLGCDLEDPETSKPAITILALGDWGGTLGKDNGDGGSCCRMYNGTVDTRSTRYQVDFYAQAYVGMLMGQSAAQLHPARILSHGDSFYWNGVGPADAKYRFEESFEKVYNAPSLLTVPWLNVAGNHDIGGANFMCGEADGQFRECDSLEELLKYMDIRFEAQAKYKSPNHDRWILRDHYYVERVTRGAVSVDVFNIDTNYADNHGALQVCCQCYGYAPKLGISTSVCGNPQPGELGCVGGNRTLFQACMDKISGWGEESLQRALHDVAASTATFKIINTHFSPHYHMNTTKMNQWYNVCENAGVTAWFNGHTHAFNHDISSWGTHFFQNGGGGGIITETSPTINNTQVKTQWFAPGTPYGFLELSFSHDWLKVQFATFDGNWTFGGLHQNATHVGGVQRGHCWFIPRTFKESRGLECNSSVDGFVGAPHGDNI
ncbi:unnamed protein product [Aphanomyces euteiches]